MFRELDLTHSSYASFLEDKKSLANAKQHTSLFEEYMRSLEKYHHYDPPTIMRNINMSNFIL